MSETSKIDDTLEEHLRPDEENTDSAYLAWKEAKIRVGPAQSKDRAKMISAHKLWTKLGLER
jgi:hypothetical protein